jgi:hypothetical protein
MEIEGRVERTVTRVPLRDQLSDLAYWQSRPDEERLAALEAIRREYDGWRCGSEPGVERVSRIVRLRRG